MHICVRILIFLFLKIYQSLVLLCSSCHTFSLPKSKDVQCRISQIWVFTCESHYTAFLSCNYYRNQYNREPRDGLGVKMTSSSSRGPRFESQHTLQSTVLCNSSPRGSMLSILFRLHKQVVHRHTQGKIPIHIKTKVRILWCKELIWCQFIMTKQYFQILLRVQTNTTRPQMQINTMDEGTMPVPLSLRWVLKS